MRRILLTGAALACLASAGTAQAASGDYYLALGDSLAAGIQSQPSVSGGAYATRLGVHLQSIDPGIQVMNIACSGATTTTLVSQQTCRSGFSGTQLQQAEAFLTANRGHVPLVTIDIGGNDVDGCARGSAIDGNCLKSGFAAIDKNVPRIVSGLAAAAGPETRFAMMTYYDPFLEYWVTGSNGQQLASESVPFDDALNAKLRGDFGPTWLVADVSTAFATDDMADMVATSTHGTVPKDVSVICQLTGGCDHGFDLHANSFGHQLIADTFYAALTAPVPSVPAASSPPAPSAPPALPGPLSSTSSSPVPTPLLRSFSLRHLHARGRVQLRYVLSAPASVGARIVRRCPRAHSCKPRLLTFRGKAGLNLYSIHARRGHYSVQLAIAGGTTLHAGFRVR